MRSKAEKIKNDYKHIARKQRIIKEVYQGGFSEDVLKQPHRLSKIKVHCSCPMCSVKMNKDGYSHSDKKKLLSGEDI